MALIAIDAGTTGITALLYDERLTIRRRAYREFPQHYPRSGWVEHRAEELLAALDECLAELRSDPASAEAQAIGLTNQRETVFALERGSAKALAPGIVWQDRRTAERCRELVAQGAGELLTRRTGLLADPYFSATKIEWLLRADAELARRARAGEVRFATVDALIVAHLTGGETLATEPTNASRTLLYDIDRRAWDGELCALFGVEPDWLPEVRPSAGDFGSALPKFLGREVPIRGVAGDQQAALFGQGGFEPGGLKTTYGTGLFALLLAGDRRPRAEGGLLTTLGVDSRGGPAYALEGSAFQGGSIVQWLRDELGLFERAADSEALAAGVPDTGGVVLVPAFTGLGAPYWDPDARGALLGLTRGTNRGHLARAALEAIAFQVVELVELVRAGSGLALDEMRVDGGAAANDLLMQLQADLAGLVVRRPEDLEATLRGAAMLAGLGAGLWSEAQGIPTPPTTDFSPRTAQPERAERLAAWREAVRRVLTR